jgi:hypothetical protein
MTRTEWLAVVITTGVGVWLWNRAKESSPGPAAERGTVIFANAPIPSPAVDER